MQQTEKIADYVEMGGLSSDSDSIDDDALRSVDAFSSDDESEEFEMPPIIDDNLIPTTPQMVEQYKNSVLDEHYNMQLSQRTFKQ